jgi:hypothetical protein
VKAVKRSRLLGLLALCLIQFGLHAQTAPHNTGSNLHVYEDSLKKIGYTIINSAAEPERKNANYAFIKTLVRALKISNSFQYPFDSLKTITITNSPDQKFRLFTWHVLNQDGSYRFYGAIQMNAPTLVLHPLEDYTPFFKNAEDTVTDNRRWLGAQYYKIVHINAVNPYYILLGWKGNTIKSTKKVIEVLSFAEGKPVFGSPLFVGNQKTRSRVIFEYTRQASMLLRYSAAQSLIVFDHLAPPGPKFIGQYDTYGPDLSYSGYRLKEGRWEFVDNLDMRNVPDSRDEQYIDPKLQAEKDKSVNGGKGKSR